FREIVEWDLVFDQVDFDWSATGESTKMDFENIATHELGHSTGMNDLYNSSCNLETMFGYASDGETIKRDLHTGDINGINLLY
ncbi:MAG: matrilysin (Metalloproteinase), partial [uncultured bacterium]